MHGLTDLSVGRVESAQLAITQMDFLFVKINYTSFLLQKRCCKKVGTCTVESKDYATFFCYALVSICTSISLLLEIGTFQDLHLNLMEFASFMHWTPKILLSPAKTFHTLPSCGDCESQLTALVHSSTVSLSSLDHSDPFLCDANSK